MLVPTVLLPGPNGERAYDLYSRLLSDRIIFLGSAIEETVANLVVGQLLHLDAEHPDRPISLYINSPGGEMTGFFAILDTMRFVQAPVHTICVGQAASAAAVLLAAGEPGHRYALPNARVLLHQPHGGAQGQSVDIEIQVRDGRDARTDGRGARRGNRTDSGATHSRPRPRLHPARPGCRRLPRDRPDPQVPSSSRLRDSRTRWSHLVADAVVADAGSDVHVEVKARCDQTGPVDLVAFASGTQLERIRTATTAARGGTPLVASGGDRGVGQHLPDGEMG